MICGYVIAKVERSYEVFLLDERTVEENFSMAKIDQIFHVVIDVYRQWGKSRRSWMIFGYQSFTRPWTTWTRWVSGVLRLYLLTIGVV